MRFTIKFKMKFASFFLGMFIPFQAQAEKHLQPSWCAALQPGSSDTSSDPIALANLHAKLRFFSVNNKYSLVDIALVNLLALQTPLHILDLSAYSALTDVCILNTKNQDLNPLTILIENDIAFIQPGKGAIHLPNDLSAAVIDLRNLPNTPDLRDILSSIISNLTQTDMLKPTERVRVHYGLTDEVNFKENPYGNTIELLPQEKILGRYQKDLPLFLITDTIMPPVVAEFVLNLRLQNRAWLVGASVYAQVAESEFYALHAQGIAFRTKEFLLNGKRWPDNIAPDYSLDEFQQLLTHFTNIRVPNKIWDEGNRIALEVISPFKDIQPISNLKSDLFASLVITFGTIKHFFPFSKDLEKEITHRYFDELHIINSKPNINMLLARDVLRRFGEAIEDGHNEVWYQIGDRDYEGSPGFYFFPVALKEIDKKIVVRRSLVEGISSGDIIEKINGKDAQGWLTHQLSLTSADTLGYKYDKALRELQRIYDSTALFVTVRSFTGKRKTIHVKPASLQTFLSLKEDPSLRKDGWLADLDAPDLFYFNLGLEESEQTFTDHFLSAINAKGIILDVRGYPNINHFVIAERFLCVNFLNRIFKTPQWMGPSLEKRFEPIELWEPKADVKYCGPIILLVGTHSASRAEDFAAMLVDSKRATVIGEQTAGVNGNITGVQLPASFAFTFTGMEALRADGITPFRKTGIIPDIFIKETPEDYFKQHDRVLEKAVEVLKINRQKFHIGSSSF